MLVDGIAPDGEPFTNSEGESAEKYRALALKPDGAVLPVYAFDVREDKYFCLWFVA